ncbi:hypothetical protein GCM10011505_44390 [Tistrella bauzanensis]|uniref:Uncharacterized protein n=1 Tax=Tistrella bauzanensis TaxID=657419 RepID=A0ABQ1J2T1_9PROT|nr:hypothetical protein GCM10011505_44390 [Tistrella bauzanensis]
MRAAASVNAVGTAVSAARAGIGIRAGVATRMAHRIGRISPLWRGRMVAAWGAGMVSDGLREARGMERMRQGMQRDAGGGLRPSLHFA